MRIAAIQMVSTDQLDVNLQQAGVLLDRAAAAGAKLALLPEHFAFIGRDEHAKLALAETAGQGPIQEFLTERARTLQLWLAAGTIPLRSDQADKVYSSCLLYAPDGARTARYDKIHLFDVTITETETYRESTAVSPGHELTVVQTPLACIGLSICYDLRFPELYRNMHDHGVQLLLVPAAFTAQTGRAHWELLLRARAVENLCYVLAANQGGQHATGRSTWGHSMAVDSWGTILAEADTGPDVVLAELDLTAQTQLRQRFPVLTHRRLGCAAP